MSPSLPFLLTVLLHLRETGVASERDKEMLAADAGNYTHYNMNSRLECAGIQELTTNDKETTW